MNSTADHTRSGALRPKNPPAPVSRTSRDGFALLRVALLTVAALVIPSAALAQEAPPDSETSGAAPPASSDGAAASGSDKTGTVLWLFHDETIAGERATAFREGLRDALADSSRRHLLSRRDLRNYLDGRRAPVPRCLQGVEPCVSPRALVFDQLALDAVVRTRLDAADGSIRAEYRLLDRRGRVAKRAELERKTPKELAFALVRELFDATGTVSIRSTPSGANVRIDGETFGSTPVEVRLPVGTHTIALRHPNRQPVEGRLEVTSGADLQLERELPEKEAELVVRDAPKKAIVYVDGRRRGRPGTTIEVEPGSYEVAVRADGYNPFRTTMTFEPGETIRRSIPLDPDPSILKDIPADRIAVNRYVGRVTFDQSLHATSFRDARGVLDDRTYEFQGFTGEDGRLSSDGPLLQTFDPRGLRVDISYTGRYFGVVPLSLSYSGTSADLRASFETAPPTERERTGTVTGLRRLQLRPLQVTYRRFFKNFVPSLELGTGISFQWIDVEDLTPGESTTFRQTEAFWTLGLAGQYFFNRNWFGVVRYSFQDYFDRGKGVEHVVSIGVGAAYPDLFGFAPEPPEEL